VSLFLSSCGIQWESNESLSDSYSDGQGKVKIDRNGSDDKQISLSALRFDAPPRPLNTNTTISFNFSEHEHSLIGSTIEVRHARTGRVMFRGDANDFIGETFSFNIPFSLMGEGAKDYQVVQSSGDDQIVTDFSIGDDNSALYVFR